MLMAFWLLNTNLKSFCNDYNFKKISLLSKSLGPFTSMYKCVTEVAKIKS